MDVPAIIEHRIHRTHKKKNGNNIGGSWPVLMAVTSAHLEAYHLLRKYNLDGCSGSTNVTHIHIWIIQNKHVLEARGHKCSIFFHANRMLPVLGSDK